MEFLRTDCNQRILVVDDEEFCLSGLKAVLMTLGIDVVQKVDLTMSPSEGLKYLECATNLGLSYSLILTDIQMPELDGIEFTKRVR